MTCLICGRSACSDAECSGLLFAQSICANDSDWRGDIEWMIRRKNVLDAGLPFDEPSPKWAVEISIEKNLAARGIFEN